MNTLSNLFDRLPDSLVEEQIEILFLRPHARIERIVSDGQASPVGFWYDQDEIEWVLLLQGSAVLEFQDEPRFRELQPGDFLLIPAHQKHRVHATASNGKTIWLALFYIDSPIQGP
ncbi:MAG: cupin domain-containing protein [Thermoguttaceae bacterium]